VKAISLWQPWAHLIAIGAKRYETRSWSNRYRGPMAIHASVRWNQRMIRQCYEEPFFSILSRAGIRLPAKIVHVPNLGMAFGAVIAVAHLADVLPASEVLPQLGPQEVAFGDFSHGRYAWLYENPCRLAVPVVCTGRQGVFELGDNAVAMITSQLEYLT
jgi:hypothetical protein